MEPQETVDLSQIQPGMTIDVNNQFYRLGKPIISADTFQQMISLVRTYSGDVPVLVITPTADDSFTVDYQQSLTHFVNCFVQVAPVNQRKLVTSRTIDNWSEQDIDALSYGNPDVEAVLYCARKHAACLADCEALSAEMDELIHKQNVNTLTDEDRTRGNLVYNTLLPNAKIACQRALDELKQAQQKCAQKALTKSTDTVTDSANDTAIERVIPTVPAEIVQSVSVQTASQTMPVQTQAPVQMQTSPQAVVTAPMRPVVTADDVITNAIRRLTFKWKCADYYCMPLHVARTCVTHPDYVAYSAYQRPVEGYTLVPPELLILFGIKMYTPDLPIVFTKLGEFRRVGESSHSEWDLNYWYPKPRYYTK